jgi:hypothetical protein
VALVARSRGHDLGGRIGLRARHSGSRILIVEVKGGAIECRDGQWYQSGHRMTRSPREQAHGFLRVLQRKLEDTYNGPLPPILIATAFPQTPFQAPPSHGDLTNAVLGQQDLAWLGTALEEMVDRQLGKTASVKDQGWSSALHRLWGETWLPRISLGARIQLRGHELVPSTPTSSALSPCSITASASTSRAARAPERPSWRAP